MDQEKPTPLAAFRNFLADLGSSGQQAAALISHEHREEYELLLEGLVFLWEYRARVLAGQPDADPLQSHTFHPQLPEMNTAVVNAVRWAIHGYISDRLESK
jgi:hypothetical protein